MLQGNKKHAARHPLDARKPLLVRRRAVASPAAVVLIVMLHDGLADNLLHHRRRDLRRVVRVAAGERSAS